MASHVQIAVPLNEGPLDLRCECSDLYLQNKISDFGHDAVLWWFES
jgi:hypothetical protein